MREGIKLQRKEKSGGCKERRGKRDDDRRDERIVEAARRETEKKT